MSTMDQALAAIAGRKTLSTAQAATLIAQTTGLAGTGQPPQPESHAEIPVSLG